MRRIALAVLAASLFAAPALAQSLTVRPDQAVRIALGAPAKDVAVGNPAIADVTVMDDRNILVLGKSYGTTNIVVLDRAGRMILDRTIIVAASDAGQVSLYKGGSSAAYVCSPRCEATGPAEAPKAPTP